MSERATRDDALTHEQFTDEIMRLYKAMEWASVRRFGRGETEGKQLGTAVHFSIGLLLGASKRLDAPASSVLDEPPMRILR